MTITNHKHSGLGGDGEKINFNDLLNKPNGGGGGGGFGNNWALMFTGTSGTSIINTTTVLPLSGGFTGGGVIDIDTVNYRMTVNESGYYYIQFLGNFELLSTQRIYARIKKNGTQGLFVQYWRESSTFSRVYHPINVSGFYFLNAGDYIEAIGFANGRFAWFQRDINSDWTTGGGENEEGTTLEMYKL